MEFKLKFFSRTYLRFCLSNLLVFGAETFLDVTPKRNKARRRNEIFENLSAIGNATNPKRLA
jgi:hypothetical protein